MSTTNIIFVDTFSIDYAHYYWISCSILYLLFLSYLFHESLYLSVLFYSSLLLYII